MGLPNKITPETTTVLSEKNLQAMLKHDFFEELNNKEKNVPSVSVLKIKLPLTGADHHEEDDDDVVVGCRTPKAKKHIKNIPLKCPPPPRKPKSVPSTKRKRQRDLLDLSNEIESLFPSNILRDFMCGKIKKVRTENPECL